LKTECFSDSPSDPVSDSEVIFLYAIRFVFSGVMMIRFKSGDEVLPVIRANFCIIDARFSQFFRSFPAVFKLRFPKHTRRLHGHKHK
jgi:hypothetical protein